MTKRKLAVTDSDSDSGDSSEPLAVRHLASSSKSKGKAKETKKKSRKRSRSEDEVEEEYLLADHRAGLFKSNGNGKGKQKGKARAVTTEKGKGKQPEATKRRSLAVEQDDSDTEEGDDSDGDDGYTTMSVGSLHDADSEDGLGEWTKDDGERYQMEEFPEPDFIQPKSSDGSEGDFEVDIVIRWRWHPRRHFAQYRVKWTGYSDIFNLWEPVTSFGTIDPVKQYWEDVEHAGLSSRPKRWDKGPNDDDEGLDSDDTEKAVTSKDARKRKAARKRKRRDIRIDRVEMRKAYARKNARKLAEEETKKQKIEANRKKKEKDEATAAAKKAPTKTVLTPAKAVRGVDASKSSAASTSSINRVEPSKSAANGVDQGPLPATIRVQQTRPILPSSVPSSSSSSVPAHEPSSSTADGLAVARAFLTESDAKLRADKRKAKVDEALRKGHLSISPSSSEAEINKTAANGSTASSSRSNGSGLTGSNEEKAKGAFRGAHKNLKKIKTLEPGRSNAPTTKGWDLLGQLLKSTSSSSSTNAPQLTASQEAMPPPAIVSAAPNGQSGLLSGGNNEGSTSSSVAPTSSSVPAAASSPTTPSYPSFRPMTALRNGPLRMGHDPRSFRSMPRPVNGGQTSTSHPSSNGNASPATVANASPQHSTQSPMHTQAAVPSPNHVPTSPMHNDQGQPPSPRHAVQSHQRDSGRDQPEALAGYIDPNSILGLTDAEKTRALDAMQRWRFTESLKRESEVSYNFQPHYKDEDEQHRRLMQHIISICKGGRPSILLEKHKQPGRRNIVWIPSAKYPLSAMDREALPYHNFKFVEYNDAVGVLQIWPFTSHKIIMFTFGALMTKLIDQCYVVKSKQRWVIPDTTIMIHPWQKAILQQLIDADMLRSFIEQILNITDDVANKEFALSESGRDVLDDFEEVPLEYLNSEATGRDEPLVSELDLSDMVLNVDKETSATLHRLQYERRQHCRFFTLIMAKTRLACSEVPTLYRVVQ